MAGILEYLQDLITAFFIRDPYELQKRRRLRDMYDELRQVRPFYYRRSSQQLQPEFAAEVLRLAFLLRPLREVFALQGLPGLGPPAGGAAGPVYILVADCSQG